MSDQEVQGMLIQLEATTAQLRRELANADQVVERTTRSIDSNLARVDSSFDATGAAAQKAGTLIKGAFAAVAGAGLVGGIIKSIDAYGQMSDRMKAAAGSGDEYNTVQEHLLRTAQETYRPLVEAQELYIRTADVMRNLGYNTQQTLDITDSFSFLLVTNAASADKAQSALDSYSKALQTGKVEADGWVSIQDAMPTIVNAIATATGKSAAEIRNLGVQGKLSLDDLNSGLLNTVEVNRKAAADMATSVHDAIVNIQNSLDTMFGKFEESTGVVGSLSAALVELAGHMDLVSAAMLGAGAGALTLYVSKGALAIKTAIADRAARIAQADAVLQAAIADQRKAQTATILAAREAEAAKTTAVATSMSIELAQARQREAAATAAVATAQAGMRTATTGLVGLLGGPMGLALLAGTAAASFLLLRDNADQAGVSLDDLHKPVQQLREEFQKLNQDQRAAAIAKWTDEQATATGKVSALYQKLGEDILASVADPRFDTSQAMGNLPKVYQEIVEQLNAAKASGQSLAPILQQVGQRFNLDPAVVASWIKQSGAISDADQRSAQIAETLRVLTGALNDNTASTTANNAAKAGMSSAGTTYLQTLQKQLGSLQDNGDALKTANRFISDNADLTETDRQAILSAANAIEKQKQANKAAQEATKGRTQAVKDEVKALDTLLDKALPERKRLTDLAEGVEGLRKAHAAGKITADEMELGIKNLDEAYADTTLQQRTKEEQKLAEVRRNSAEAYRKAMEVVLQARQDAIDADVASVGMGDDESSQAERLNAVRAKYADARRALEEQQEDASRRLSQSAYEQRLADLSQYQARELQMEVDGYTAKLAAQADYRNGARRAWANIQADANDVAGATDNMLTTGFETARDALADFATSGKLKFKDFTNSVISDMARIAAQQAASSLLSGLLGLGVSAVSSYFGGSSSAGATQSGYTGSAFSTWKAAQAKGGGWDGGVQFFAKGAGFTNSVVSTPTAFGMAGGQTGVMGEAGPEAIMPLARAADGSLGVRAVGGSDSGGGTAIAISAPVSVTVADRSSEGMQIDEQALQQSLQTQMKGVAEKAIADSWRAGGTSYLNSSRRS